MIDEQSEISEVVLTFDLLISAVVLLFNFLKRGSQLIHEDIGLLIEAGGDYRNHRHLSKENA